MHPEYFFFERASAATHPIGNMINIATIFGNTRSGISTPTQPGMNLAIAQITTVIRIHQSSFLTIFIKITPFIIHQFTTIFNNLKEDIKKERRKPKEEK